VINSHYKYRYLYRSVRYNRNCDNLNATTTVI